MKKTSGVRHPLKAFLFRGLLFGGSGPMIAGIIYLILDLTLEEFSLGGTDVFTAILSTYLLAFVHAGASVFYQIESWSLGRSVLYHFTLLYASYALCYVVNDWLPFDPLSLGIFTAVFAAIYAVIWLCISVSIRLTVRRLNRRLK